jgi:Phage portal protein
MPEGGKVTPISPSFIQRVSQGVRYMISGVGPEAWFGPMQPLQPMAPPDVVGRRFDYPVGYNLSYSPRSYEPVSFADLRGLADSCDVLRSVIETRKDQMEALDWNVRIKPDDDNKRKTASADQQKRIDAITEFFQYPDKRNTWQQWLRQWLEDMFVLDAACFYKRLDRKGRLWGLEPVDGATVKILLDDSGRSPLPPNPAYQQILHGIPAADYAMYGGDENGVVEYGSNELLYLMRNPRTHKPVGYSHVEQVLMTVNIAIRRAMFQLEYYREGSQPDALLGLPKEWTTEQIIDFQKNWDAMNAGNLGQRRRLKFLPGEFKYEATKPPDLKDEYDEWLARVICYVFSVPPTPFIKAARSGEAQKTSHDAALEEGLAPLQKYVKNNLNRVIAIDFESPDIEFGWVDDREQDPLQSAQIREGDVKCGIISIDEARQSIGLDPLGDAYGVPMPLTPTGFVAVKSPEQQDADNQAQQQAMQDAASARLAGNQSDEHGGGDEGKPQEKNKTKQKDDATKLAKAVKKKPNPYLPTTAQSQSLHARP